MGLSLLQLSVANRFATGADLLTNVINTLAFVPYVEQILAGFQRCVDDEIRQGYASQLTCQEYLCLIFRTTTHRACVRPIRLLFPLAKVLSLLNLSLGDLIVRLTSLGRKLVVSCAVSTALHDFTVASARSFF